jgi:tRNA(Ile)-lysidine synthase
VHTTIRPLLDVARDQLLEYAQQHGLSWIEDESNADQYYPRNFLRHRLLPSLQEKFPAYRETLMRSAKHFAEADLLLDELARQDMQGSVNDTTLDVSLLRALSYARAKNLLRYFLYAQQAPMPQEAQLADMLRQLCDASEDAAVCIFYGEWQVRRYQDKVYALRALADFDQNTVMFWSGESELEWPALSTRLVFNRGNPLDEELSVGASLLAKSFRQQAGSYGREAAQGQSGLKQNIGHGISLAKLQHAQVTLRLRSGGEALRPHPNAATRSLKNLLQEHCVPPWERERLPLLYCGNDLACVVGVAVHAGYQAQHDEESVLVSCGKFDYHAANKNL